MYSMCLGCLACSARRQPRSVPCGDLVGPEAQPRPDMLDPLSDDFTMEFNGISHTNIPSKLKLTTKLHVDLVYHMAAFPTALAFS